LSAIAMTEMDATTPIAAAAFLSFSDSSYRAGSGLFTNSGLAKC
jgi:hypothetical protein